MFMVTIRNLFTTHYSNCQCVGNFLSCLYCRNNGRSTRIYF